MLAQVIMVRLLRTPENWIVATSNDLPGLFISHPDRETVVSDIAPTIKAIYKEQYKTDVEVFVSSEVTHQEELRHLALPVELIAEQASVSS